jgi:hypothetical protein
VPVICAECRATYSLSRPRAKHYEHRPFRCEDCRRPPIELTDEERERYEAWWEENFTPGELAKLRASVSLLAA